MTDVDYKAHNEELIKMMVNLTQAMGLMETPPENQNMVDHYLKQVREDWMHFIFENNYKKDAVWPYKE